MMTTPAFFTGGPIPSGLATEHFHGYEEERRTLIQYLNRRGNKAVVVKGATGSGKTSLLLSVASQLGGPYVHIECRRIWPATALATFSIIEDALAGGPRRKGRANRPESYGQLDVPRIKDQGTLVLDDVDALAEIDPRLVVDLSELAGHVTHRLVVTSGAPVPVLGDDEVVTLAPLSDASGSDLVTSRLARAQLQATHDALSVFHEFSEGRPAALQLIGQAVVEVCREQEVSEVAAEHVDIAVARLVDRLPATILTPWLGVRGIMRDIFVAMCLHDMSRPTEIARRLQAEPKNIVALLGRLTTQHGLIHRVDRGTYKVRDPLLKHYVRKRWGSPMLR